MFKLHYVTVNLKDADKEINKLLSDGYVLDGAGYWFERKHISEDGTEFYSEKILVLEFKKYIEEE